MAEKAYTAGEKVVEADSRFKHVMSISLNPDSNYKEGVIRCITSRSGDLAIKGGIDRSELHKIIQSESGKFVIGERLSLKNEDEMVKKLNGTNLDLLGFEDPDIFTEKETGLMHLYFTMPFHDKEFEDKSRTHLGHAVGKDLNDLEMTEPVLVTDSLGNGAKELSIAPLNSKGFRYNLVESSKKGKEFIYSTVRVAEAHDMGKSWVFGDTVFDPEDCGISWIAGHASPGPLFPKSFIDLGSGKLLGIMNGCQANQKIVDDIKYGNFNIGLFIYDYENGKIDWVSQEPFIQDSEAGKGGGRAITFASQFVEMEPGKGILYAHIDDSFVRSYYLNAEELKKLIPNS